ncbi:MAG TPA: Ig-like domain-containing protein [Solirubrobacteraceae bacterium]|nr:Ig-like domain-containing protein [Solirubrobacteraceae bacterium]
MRRSFPVLASAGVAAACAAAPSLASAAPHPHQNRGLTIHATPSHVIAGDPVLIYGHLRGPHNVDRRVTLYHRVSGAHAFTVVRSTRTNADGKYFFPHAQDIVMTNRSWFVRGPHHTHSMTVHERVAAEVTLSPSTTTGLTRHPIVFTGEVTPGHGGRVALQVQTAAGNTWRTVARGTVGRHGHFTIRHGWRVPGPRTVRAYFPGNRFNTAAASDQTAVVINQMQAPFFTIHSSDPVLADGQTATISGVLKKAHTSVGDAGVTIGLYGHVPQSDAPFALMQTTTTGAGGAYSFTVAGTTNELYQARVIGTPGRRSALIFQGVKDTVTLTPSATSSTVGGTVTFSGSVAPDNAGHAVMLEYRGRDGHWQVATTSTVLPNSTYSIPWTFGSAGTKRFRVHVAGGPQNVGGVSAPVTITVAQPTLGSLP